jgi:hypothetical protein
MLVAHGLLLLAATTALAKPLIGLVPRQSDPFAHVTNVATRGADCGQIFVVGNDTLTQVGFTAYSASQPPTSNREKFCDIIFTVHFPLGCTSLIFDNVLSGDAILSPGVTGRVHTSFVLDHGGQLSNPNPADLQLTSSGPWAKDSAFLSQVTINTPSQQDVLFTAQTRIALQGSGSGQIIVNFDTLALLFQSTCG